MSEVREESSDERTKIVGIGYDGRRDKHTWAMVPDKATGKSKMRMVVEEHESVVNILVTSRQSHHLAMRSQP